MTAQPSASDRKVRTDRDDERPAGGQRLAAYNSVWQLRVDLWWSIADAARRLAMPSLDEGTRADLAAALHRELADVEALENYYAFPGRRLVTKLRDLANGSYGEVSRAAEAIGRSLVGDAPMPTRGVLVGERDDNNSVQAVTTAREDRPTFEVLVVADLSSTDANKLRRDLRSLRRPEDAFVYDLVFVPSLEDAVVAVMVNARIQAAIVRPDFRTRSGVDLSLVAHFFAPVDAEDIDARPAAERAFILAERLQAIRPEVDHYLVGHAAVELLATQLGNRFDRVFLHQDALELHLSILRGVAARYRTPFFTALTKYSRKPTGVFHAMPISRGNSVVNSPWIHDMSDFYGLNVFLAETSATSGGLDSLLEPHGPMKEAQTMAARAFGARQTFFVTNGTSTANKIVTQSLVAPGDIVLVDRNCHKSHHYAQVLAGSNVAYLDSYSIDQYSMYGAIAIADIKRVLLTYRREGRLDRVKMISLTNCTFDGVVYDVERVMTECLAIKPDLVFLWDEAWYAFARFHPVYRRRTAMATAATLSRRFRSPEYRAEYERQHAELAGADDESLIRTRLLPDPRKVRIRTYATQSTHKTLTSLRQGSMIHVFDEDFSQSNEEAFHEAYMTHTSTSPNYQVLASLDVGRRQVELEGFELVQRQVELSMTVRDRIAAHPLLSKYFRVLGSSDLIPDQYRPWGRECPLHYGPMAMEQAWSMDEFVLDPCRLTILICATGIDGDTFKHEFLMDRWGIQVNKTSRNTALAMTNIGTTRSSVAYLLEALMGIAEGLEADIEQMGPLTKQAFERRVRSLTSDHPPLPDFSEFHDAFRANPAGSARDGNMRKAYFMAYRDELCEYLSPRTVRHRVETGLPVVSAIFVTPYPPGFPVLVPGQAFSKDILDFMDALDTREIHGYDPSLGYRVFTQAALDGAAADREALGEAGFGSPVPVAHSSDGEPTAAEPAAAQVAKRPAKAGAAK
jgi:arginine decarboxylase